jgi:hypothetical protein
MTQLDMIIEAAEVIFAPTPTKKAPKKAKAITQAKMKADLKAKLKAVDELFVPAQPRMVVAQEPKPEYKGFNVKEGTDLKALEADLVALSEAVAAISNKDSDLLVSYLMIGQGAAAIAPLFASTKLYGQFLAKEIPASSSLDPALRSNCKWLFEALNVAGHEASDLLVILDVNRIEDFKSGNPTVIKREYKSAVKAAEALNKAKALGLDCETSEQAEKEVKAVANAEKAEAEKKAAAALKRAVAAYVKKTKESDTSIDVALADFEALIMSALFDSADDTLATLKDITKAL